MHSKNGLAVGLCATVLLEVPETMHINSSNRQTAYRPKRRDVRRARSGAITLELILCLPVWIIVLAATLEFGLLISRLQQVALAARVGAMEAAQTDGIQEFVAFPTGVETVVDRQLQSAKGQSDTIEYCRLILEYRLGGTVATPLVQDGNTPCNCQPIDGSDLPFPNTDCGDYVRVTVCVRMSELAPNLLKVFGFDISGKFVQHTATYAYESGSLGTGSGCSCGS